MIFCFVSLSSPLVISSQIRTFGFERSASSIPTLVASPPLS
ncbi:hypothetical protein VB002_10155 [Campylobacter concisus]